MEKKALVFRINDNGIGPELLHQVFLEKGWLEYDEDKHDQCEWNIWWKTSRFRTSEYDKINPWQRLNHYPNSVGITRKDFLARTLKRMKGVYGSGVYNFSPIAFNVPNDYTKFVAEYTKMKQTVDSKSLLWICKPADLSRGRGIFLFRELSELQYDCSAVIQRYVSNPFLIAGYKYDIRIYVAVPSFHPLTVYIHQEGLVRFSTEKFDLNSINNVYAHLTNTSINKHSPSYTHDKERVGPGCKWTLTQLRYYFHQKGIDDRRVWLRIVNIVILTLITQVPCVPKVENCFELYGFDILIDEKLKPWLLEVNFSPALASDCQADILVKKPLLHDLLEMLNFKSCDADRGGDSVQTQSVYKSRSNIPYDHHQNPSNRHNATRTGDASKRLPGLKNKSTSDTQSEHYGDSESVEQRPIFGLPLVCHSDDEGIDEMTESNFETDSTAPEVVKESTDAGSTSTEATGSQRKDSLGTRSVCTLRKDTIEARSVSMTLTSSAKSVTRKEDGNKNRISSAKWKKSIKHGYGLHKVHSKTSNISDSGVSSFSGSRENSDLLTRTNSDLLTRRNSDGNSHKSAVAALPSETAVTKPVASSLGKSSVFTRIKRTSSVQWQSMERKPGHPGLVRLAKSPLKRKSTHLTTVTKVGQNAYVGSLDNYPGAAGGHLEDKDEARAASRASLVLGKVITSKKKSAISADLLCLPRMPNNKLSNPKQVSVSQHKLMGVRKPSVRACMSPFNKTTPPPKDSPKRIGEFYLVFPFNEVTKKSSHPVLDCRVIIRETQKLMKESLLAAKTPGKGHGQVQSLIDEPNEKLWASLHTINDS